MEKLVSGKSCRKYNYHYHKSEVGRISLSAFNPETTEMRYVGNKPVSASNPLSAFCPITKEIAVIGIRNLENTCVGKIANTGDRKIVNNFF